MIKVSSVNSPEWPDLKVCHLAGHHRYSAAGEDRTGAQLHRAECGTERAHHRNERASNPPKHTQAWGRAESGTPTIGTQQEKQEDRYFADRQIEPSHCGNRLEKPQLYKRLYQHSRESSSGPQSAVHLHLIMQALNHIIMSLPRQKQTWSCISLHSR